jgi:tetratricopeptide (TPR) repeat protein
MEEVEERPESGADVAGSEGVEPGGDGQEQHTPFWLTGLVLVLILGVLVVGGLLVRSVFMPTEQVTTAAERDLVIYKQRVAAAPNDWKVRVKLAAAYLAAGEPARAITEADRAIAIEERAVDAHLVKGYAYEGMGDTAKAEKEYLEVLKYVDAASDANMRLAALYMTQNKLDKAAERLDALLAANPGAADALVLRAHVFALAGDKVKAKEMYEKALTFIPDYRDAIEGLKALEDTP